MAKIAKSDEEWKNQLSREQYYVTRKKGTEPAFTGQHWNNHEEGVYRCVCCGYYALQFRDEIRVRDRLAKFLGASKHRERPDGNGRKSRHGPNRGALRPV